MNSIKSIHIFLLLSFAGVCCADNRSVSVPESQSDTASAKKARQVLSEKLDYAKVILLSIDSSIYLSDDTIYNFPDGIQAYLSFLGGNSFVDSNGHPIHKRYHRFELSKSQDSILRENFLYELCDGLAHACVRRRI